MSGRLLYYGGIVKDGLVLLLDAAKNESYPKSGVIWNDISANKISTTLINGPTFNTNSIIFDGTNDYINLGTQSSIDFGDNGSYTFGFWLKKYSPFKDYDSLFSMGQVADQRIHFLIDSNGVFYRWSNFSTTGLTLNTWTNIVYTYSSSGVNTGTEKFFINGIQTNTRTGSMPSWISTGDRWIGRHSFGGGSWNFNGEISSFISYNRALTADEVLKNYNAIKNRFGL